MARELTINGGRTLPPEVLAAIVPERRSVRGSDGRFDEAFVVRYSVTGCPAPANLRVAIDLVEATVMPGGGDSIRELGRLRRVTRKRPTDDDAEAAKIYADHVKPYPADVVRLACDDLIRTSTWWPSIPELLQAFAKHMTPRRLLLRALRQALHEAENPPPPPPTIEEECAQLRRLVDRDRATGSMKHAALWERMLAGLEDRDPEEWARRPQKVATATPPLAQVEGLRDLAEAARERLKARASAMRAGK